MIYMRADRITSMPMREVCGPLWNLGFIGVASQTAGSKRLMRDRVAPAERSRSRPRRQHTAYRALVAERSFSLSLLRLTSARQVRLPSVHICAALLPCSAVLPHEAPSRVIALASVPQPYGPSSPAQERVPWSTPLPSRLLDCLFSCVTGSRVVACIRLAWTQKPLSPSTNNPSLGAAPPPTAARVHPPSDPTPAHVRSVPFAQTTTHPTTLQDGALPQTEQRREQVSFRHLRIHLARARLRR